MESSSVQLLEAFKGAVNSGNIAAASDFLQKIKVLLVGFQSLPPLGLQTLNADAERSFAREAFEYAALLAIKSEDRQQFQRYLSTLRPFYTSYGGNVSESELKFTIIGLNLLYLLVENRLADFHCELELLTEKQQSHPCIVFCTKLDKHLMVGSYDQVMEAASHPPVSYYSFFLTSLLETVRTNIGDTLVTSYNSLTLQAATDVLMFDKVEETTQFIAEKFPDWNVENGVIEFKGQKTHRAEEIPSVKLIAQTLSYATELERIV